MLETTVARSYAEALLELALKDEAVELYAEQLGQFSSLLESEPDFRVFLETPRIDPAAKKRVVRDVFGGVMAGHLLRFLYVTIDKGRQHFLPAIAREFTTLLNEHLGRLEVEITTAREADEALRASLQRRLSELLDREILPSYRVNPRILGGVIVKVGDRIMDGSVRQRLQRLRRSMLRAEI
ncbi:MAG: ATP synthase F1 subunit delta [Gemmatimonadota bacterium]|nr:MAG: ATP synthase F1 subunit delta [Gemmatimonadota bacterium]